jgi:hypothetical protein
MILRYLYYLKKGSTFRRQSSRMVRRSIVVHRSRPRQIQNGPSPTYATHFLLNTLSLVLSLYLFPRVPRRLAADGSERQCSSTAPSNLRPASALHPDTSFSMASPHLLLTPATAGRPHFEAYAAGRAQINAVAIHMSRRRSRRLPPA